MKKVLVISLKSGGTFVERLSFSHIREVIARWARGELNGKIIGSEQYPNAEGTAWAVRTDDIAMLHEQMVSDQPQPQQQNPYMQTFANNSGI